MSSIINNIRQEGLEEATSRFYSLYEGIVTDSEDPDFKGRIKFKCPKVFGAQIFNAWTLPRSIPMGADKTFWLLPDKNDTVYIEFISGDVSRPVWSPAYSVEKQVKVASGLSVWQYGENRITLDRKEKTIAITNGKSVQTISKDSFDFECKEFTVGSNGSIFSLDTMAKFFNGTSPISKGEINLQLLTNITTLIGGLNVAGIPAQTASGSPVASDPLYIQLTTLLPQLNSTKVFIA